MVILGIYNKSKKVFILVMVDGLKVGDTQTLFFYFEFYTQYVQLVNTHYISRPITILGKNIGTTVFGEQLVMNFSNVFIIPILNQATIDKFNKIHNKKISGQDFAINFDVLCVYFMVSFFICL
jgi:hypothetical protein